MTLTKWNATWLFSEFQATFHAVSILFLLNHISNNERILNGHGAEKSRLKTKEVVTCQEVCGISLMLNHIGCELEYDKKEDINIEILVVWLIKHQWNTTNLWTCCKYSSFVVFNLDFSAPGPIKIYFG